MWRNSQKQLRRKKGNSRAYPNFTPHGEQRFTPTNSQNNMALPSMSHASRTAHIVDMVDDLADLYLAQVADLREFAQATEAGEGGRGGAGTTHLARPCLLL
jgi:hypothetical protein